jgi:hypothetical protein
MTDPANTPASQGSADIAWMRNLAQEGASAPLKGGETLLAAGLLFGLASLAHWAAASGLTPWTLNAASVVIWPATTVAFVLFATISGSRTARAAGVRTAANRAAATVWMAVGIAIFALFVSLALIGVRLGQGAGLVVSQMIPSIIMALYGLGWAVSATMMRSGFLWRLSIASFVAAPLMAALTGSSIQYLAYAACLFGLMALPGWLLMRKARAASGFA